jgi:hypothetical protein
MFCPVNLVNTGERVVICPGIAMDCDNPGCRHGGCQGRPPQRLRQPMVPASAVILSIQPKEGAAQAAFASRRGDPVSQPAAPDRAAA